MKINREKVFILRLINENIGTRTESISISQLWFIILKGFGHLSSMAGVVTITASVIYIAVGTASWSNLFLGFLLIGLGYQLQQLGDKSDERLTIQARHLNIEIKQHFTKALTIALVASTIIAI